MNQNEADRDVPRILALKSRLNIPWVGVSCEPLLGPIDLTAIRYRDGDAEIRVNALTAEAWVENSDSASAYTDENDGNTKLDWIIVGGESGPRARDNDFLANARSLLAQCRDAAAPFFGKQNVRKHPLPDDLLVRQFPEGL